MSSNICGQWYWPREHLEKNGMPVVRDLPGVGSNLVVSPLFLKHILVLLISLQRDHHGFPLVVGRVHK
jgi:hypothetical protein